MQFHTLGRGDDRLVDCRQRWNTFLALEAYVDKDSNLGPAD
jgi:hypothetical protein